MTDEASAPVQPHRRVRRMAWTIAIVAFVVFLPSLAAGFVFDDDQLIVRNGYVHALKWLPRAFQTHLWDVSPLAVSGELNGAVETSRRYYRPLVTVSFLLSWVVGGGHAWLFHLGNVVAHAATSLLATRAAVRWTRSLVLGAAIGFVFAIHPTRTENVTWIAGRAGVVMLLFVLLALELFRARPAFGLVALACAILTKEPAIMTPFLLLAEPARTRRTSLVAAVVGCVAYALLRLFVLPPEGEHVGHALTPIAFLYTIGCYTHRIVAPWPPTMYFDAVPFDRASGLPAYPLPLTALGGVVLLALLAALVHAWRRDRSAFWLLVSAGAFFGPLLNVTSAMYVPAADRLLYAPLLFLLAGLARLLRPRLRRVLRQRAVLLALGGIGVVAIGLIELRALDFQSDATFWSAEVAPHPDNPYALRMLGRLAAARGELSVALDYYRRANGPNAAHTTDANQYVIAHFEEAGLLAGTLPDGRIDELRAISDELYRTVDPTTRPPGAEPLRDDLIMRLHDQASFAWDAALVATRTGDLDRAARAIAITKRSRVAANPLNSVLVLARVGELAEANELLRALPATDPTMHARLDRAAAITRERDAAPVDKRPVFEALRLAGLGAYWSAFRALARTELTAETAPLAVQLLVACRLDAAAKELGDRYGLDDVARIRAELPPELRAMEPVPLPLVRVLDAAKAP